MALLYACSSCGRRSAGQEITCPGCGAVGGYEPLPEAKSEKGAAVSRTVRRASSAMSGEGAATGMVRLRDVATDVPRTLTGIEEFDRAVGGGLVEGSIILVAGEPGIGKSTLLLQVVAKLVEAGSSAIYFTGEETSIQVGQRARRLGLPLDDLIVYPTRSADQIAATIAERRPAFVVVDSVQAITVSGIESEVGSPPQVKGSVSLLSEIVKQVGTTMLLVGQVNKDGGAAGPKMLEHMVDAVMMFEGDRFGLQRRLQAQKNRYGATSEVGFFEMEERGLVGVKDPTPLLVEGGEESGRAVCVVMEGTRPLLVEVQALVAKATNFNPRRTAMGVSEKKLNMILAVIERHAGIDLTGHDVWVEVNGGLTITETGADAAVAVAVVSSYWSKPVDRATVVCGEIALGSELRPVAAAGPRIHEVAGRRLFKTMLLPARDAAKGGAGDAVELVGVRNIRELLGRLGILDPADGKPAPGGSKAGRGMPPYLRGRGARPEADEDDG